MNNIKRYNQVQASKELGVGVRTIAKYISEFSANERKAYLNSKSQINDEGLRFIKNKMIEKNPKMREKLEKNELSKIEILQKDMVIEELESENEILMNRIRDLENSLHKTKDDAAMNLEKVHERYLVQIENMNQTHQRDQAIIMSLSETVKSTQLQLENKTKKGWFSRFARKG